MLAITLGTGAIGLVFMSASIPGDFAYATHSLGVGKLAFGFVLTAWAVGMIVASNTLFGRIPTAAVASATLIAAAVQGLAKFVAPFWQLYVVMLVAWAIGGMGHGIKNTGFRTLIHQRVDAAQHGRAFAAFNGLRNTAELAALAGGAVLVTTIGGRGTLWVAGGSPRRLRSPACSRWRRGLSRTPPRRTRRRCRRRRGRNAPRRRRARARARSRSRHGGELGRVSVDPHEIAGNATVRAPSSRATSSERRWHDARSSGSPASPPCHTGPTVWIT